MALSGIHSLKYPIRVFGSMAFLSLFCTVPTLREMVRGHGVWLILTGIFVNERFVGSVLHKGLNRGAGTALGCVLAFGGHSLFRVLDGYGLMHYNDYLAVALTGTVTGFVYYMRAASWLPSFDYGLLVFTLTFDYLLLSGLQAAQHQGWEAGAEATLARLFAIVFSCGVVILFSMFIFPEYAGEYLQDTLSDRLQDIRKTVDDLLQCFVDSRAVAPLVPEHRAGLYESVFDALERGLYSGSYAARTAERAAIKAAKAEPRLLNLLLKCCCVKRPGVKSTILTLRYDWNEYLLAFAAVRKLYVYVCMLSDLLSPTRTGPLEPDPALVPDILAIQRAFGNVLSVLSEASKTGLLAREEFGTLDEQLTLAKGTTCDLQTRLRPGKATSGRIHDTGESTELALLSCGHILVQMVDALDDLVSTVTALGHKGFIDIDDGAKPADPALRLRAQKLRSHTSLPVLKNRSRTDLDQWPGPVTEGTRLISPVPQPEACPAGTAAP